VTEGVRQDEEGLIVDTFSTLALWLLRCLVILSVLVAAFAMMLVAMAAMRAMLPPTRTPRYSPPVRGSQSSQYCSRGRGDDTTPTPAIYGKHDLPNYLGLMTESPG
jgi:hypothetical protein